MHALKKTTIITLISAAVLIVVLALSLVLSMTWLLSSEPGSRWLLEKGLALAPVNVEAKGISGTLADGLEVESLDIFLDDAEIKATHILLSWRPASLLAGIVELDDVNIAELDIKLLESNDSGGQVDDGSGEGVEDDDLLFWLQFPIQVNIEPGQIGKLRIDDAVFDAVNVVGNIGNGQLEIAVLDFDIVGVKLQASGELVGPEPGQLNLTASWEMPSQGLKGSGNFTGDIKELAFTQIINVPETVNFNGTIYDLFSDPSLQGIADWGSVRISGESQGESTDRSSASSSLYSQSGSFKISSDFVSAQIDGDNTVLFEDWAPAPISAPMQLQAFIDLQGIKIEAYTLDIFEGQITGKGWFDFGDEQSGKSLNGQLQINATQINAAQINTGLIQQDVPGRIDFNADLKMQSPDEFVIDVSAVNALVRDTELTGVGRVQWREEKLVAFDADIKAGSNQLTADVKLDKKLAGMIRLNAPELATLPIDLLGQDSQEQGLQEQGLQGRLNASITLGGSLARPQAHLTADGESIVFNTLSLEKFTFDGAIQANDRIKGKLTASGLAVEQPRSEKIQLGNLDFSLDGTLAKHQSSVELAGGEVDATLRFNGGWDGEYLTQRFKYGYVQASGFKRWQLDNEPELKLSAETGKLSAHCWKQESASVCTDNSNWGSDTLQSHIVIKDFALKSLQPLLADGYSIDGTVNADIKLMQNSKSFHKELHWRQTRTLLSYSDDTENVETIFDAVNIDLMSDDTQTNLTLELTGEQGLNLTGSATVNGPLASESPLKATAKGKLPSIEILRPLAQRVLHPGRMQGELVLDLDISGTLGHPLFAGGANLSDGVLEMLNAGVTMRAINIEAKSESNNRLLLNGTLQSGKGNANIQGEVHVTEKAGLVADISIQGQNLTTVRATDLSVDASPDIKLHIARDVFDISGQIKIPRATANIRQLPKNTVSRSSDIIVHTPERKAESLKKSIVTGNVEVVLGDDVHFTGFGLRSRLDGNFRLTQTRGGYLQSGGTIRVHDGFFTGYGKELRVDRGELTFTGPLDDPLINIQVSRESIYDNRQYTIGLRLTGSAHNIKTEPFSRPSMSEADVLSFLLIDRPSSTGDDASGAALALGLQQLVPGEGGVLGLDEVNFETNDANQATMVAGKRINDKLHVRYVFGTSGQPGDFRIRYSLGKGFSLESRTGAQQSMDLIYLLER
jgi:translocation and assembly module TamB